MKVTLGLLSAVVLSGLWFSAHAQVPQGSYVQSCREIRMQGRTLTAVCRRADGREQQTALDDVNRCIGDIGNNNGVLQCNRGSAPATGSPTPGHGSRRGQATGPGYAAPGYAPPPPGYGQGRGSGEGRQYQADCEGLGEAERETRDRLAFTPFGEGRGQLEDRLREIQDQRERCRRR